MERSPWPEDKAAFIDACYANEGILLEVENSCCIACGHCEKRRLVRKAQPANIKVQNNGAVCNVGSSLTVHNPLFFVRKL